MTWHYLRTERCLPATIIWEAVLREGRCGSMWAAHANDDGAITGWENRSPDSRGFRQAVRKFRVGLALLSPRFFALLKPTSVAAFEGLRVGSLYLDTSGWWSSAEAAVRKQAAGSGVVLVSATDANS